MNNPFAHRIVRITILALGASISFAAVPGARALPKTAAPANSSVWPIGSDFLGLFYGDLSAFWWQWAFSLPINHHPLFGTADCSAGQSGFVWFLGGGPSPMPNCVVPEGKALFFPIINAECSNLEGNGNTDAQLRACAKGPADLISTDPDKLYVILDGIRIEGLKHFRVQSPLFHFGPLPDNNFVQYFCETETCPSPVASAGSRGISVSDGYYLLLPPLPPGTHTLHFHGEIPDFSFVEDMTYHLTVRR